MEKVDHPAHYQTHGVECIVATRGMGFDLGNAVKYVYRARDKGDLLTDLRKARWYLNDHMRYAEAQQPIHPHSVDALRRIAASQPPHSLPRAFFHAIADGKYGDAFDTLNAMIEGVELP